MKQIIVIKIGSSVIFTKRGKLDEFRVSHLAGEIRDLTQKGVSIVLVISGAVYGGYSELNMGKPDLAGCSRQVLAGIGQAYLTAELVNIFRKKGMRMAQILVTKDDLLNKKKLINIRKTVGIYRNMGIIPVFNENDAVELNSFGGNDLLAGFLAGIVRSKNLWILSTWEGSPLGIGGKATKDEVSREMKRSGINTVILNGKIKNVLSKNIL